MERSMYMEKHGRRNDQTICYVRMLDCNYDTTMREHASMHAMRLRCKREYLIHKTLSPHVRFEVM